MINILKEECAKLGLIPRKTQLDAIKWLESVWDNENKCKVISSPVGSGKSLLSKTISEHNRLNDKVTAIITPQNLLVDQYISEFPDLNFFKGKKNYTCNKIKSTCEEGDIVNKLTKKSCDNCPYKLSKERAYNEHVTVFNPISYYALPKVGNKDGQLFIDYDVDTMVIDEFQSLPGLLRELSTIKIWEHDIKWQKKVSSSIPKIIDLLYRYLEVLNTYILSKSVDLKDRIKYSRAHKKISFIVKQLEHSANFFICEETEEKYRNISTSVLIIRPKYVPPSVYKQFFKLTKKVVLMSGTAFPNMWEELGFDKVDYIDLPSPISKERRQVFVTKSININAKMNENERSKMLEELTKQIKYIVDEIHPGENGVILAPYTLAAELKNYLTEKHFIHMDKKSKKDKIDAFKQNKVYGVGIFSGSDEGISLNDEISRFTIIPKVKYPNLTDVVVKTRLKENSINYLLETMTSIIQASGRSTRSEKDFSFTYILDSNFIQLYANICKYLPLYFKESLNFRLPNQKDIILLNNFRGQYENVKAS